MDSIQGRNLVTVEHLLDPVSGAECHLGMDDEPCGLYMSRHHDPANLPVRTRRRSAQCAGAASVSRLTSATFFIRFAT